jgi:hypothetical protein
VKKKKKTDSGDLGIEGAKEKDYSGFSIDGSWKERIAGIPALHERFRIKYMEATWRYGSGGQKADMRIRI